MLLGRSKCILPVMLIWVFTCPASGLRAFEVGEKPRQAGSFFEPAEWQNFSTAQKQTTKAQKSESAKVEKDCGTFSSLRMLSNPTPAEKRAMHCFLKHMIRREPAQLLLKMEANNWEKGDFVLIRYRVLGAKDDGVLLEKKILEVKMKRKFHDAKPWVQRVLPLAFVRQVIRQAKAQGKAYLACPGIVAAITADSVKDPETSKEIKLPPYRVLKQ